MPTDVMVSLQGLSNLSKDRYVNTLHFDGDDWGNAEATELWGKYQTFLATYGGDLAGGGHEIRCYHPGMNPDGPYFAKTFSLSNGQKSTSGPPEVALCLSYAAVDNPDQSTPRRRGRIFLGPLTPSVMAGQRPDVSLRNAALTLGDGIAQVGLASNVTWMLRSAVGNSYHKIESIWVDDTWDTQRRRGNQPTLKTVRDVQ
jgi:hypothetical protein